MNEVKISVILPVYNGERFLKESMDSVLSQTFTQFELIIINDGSTDKSAEIIASFKDQRIRVLNNQPNAGLIASLNRGLREAKGDYIARMDADDVALPERFQLQLSAFEKDPQLVLVATDHYSLVNDKTSVVRNRKDSDELKAILLFSPSFAHPTVMMKNFFRNQSLSYDPEFQHVEDFRLWTVLASQGKFGNVDRPSLKYRAHSGQVSVKYHDIQISNGRRVREAMLHDFGFTSSTSDLEVHHAIGENVFITSAQLLQAIEKWLLNLKNQNQRSGKFNVKSFNNVLNKFWYDSCGHSNLGLKAYRIYFGSELSEFAALELKDKLLLLLKCVWRRYRKN